MPALRRALLHVCIVVLHILGIGVEVDPGWSSVSIELWLELETTGGKERVREGDGVTRWREEGTYVARDVMYMYVPCTFLHCTPHVN